MKYELVKQLEAAGYPVSTPNVPTLEELIEACGENFSSLNKYENVWDAESSPQLVADIGAWSGSTPTEAVARLYLALYNKGNATTNKNTGAN